MAPLLGGDSHTIGLKTTTQDYWAGHYARGHGSYKLPGSLKCFLKCLRVRPRIHSYNFRLLDRTVARYLEMRTQHFITERLERTEMSECGKTMKGHLAFRCHTRSWQGTWLNRDDEHLNFNHITSTISSIDVLMRVIITQFTKFRCIDIPFPFTKSVDHTEGSNNLDTLANESNKCMFPQWPSTQIIQNGIR